MPRTLISDLQSHIGETVHIEGSVDVRRDHGKIIFLDIRDRSGSIQSVAVAGQQELFKVAQELKPEWVVGADGLVKKRPEKMVNAGVLNGDLELELQHIDILGRAKELPFEKDAELNIDTYLDHLPLTLRTQKARAVFRIQAGIVTLYREFLNKKGFTEIQTPKLIGEDAEGGANSFNVDYFGFTAHLGQSPQLYKQIMVGALERVFAVGNVYRAEPHSTTRHLNEYTSLDIEMGFIKDHHDVMNVETELLRYIINGLTRDYTADIALLEATLPEVPAEIPFMTLREAQQLITKETGQDCTHEPDLEPQHERWLCEYATQKLGSEFIFITHFPVEKRPFYTYEDEANPGFTKGFDLLCRGLEITTGAQRIHDYDTLVASLKRKKLAPEKFSFYLQAFKYGMPPHGGFGMGLERLTARFLGFDNVRTATLFPRDVNRIDLPLAK